VDAPIEAQAGNFTFSPVPNQQQNETVKFFDQSPAWDAHFGGDHDPTRASSDDPDVEFKNFFLRPVRITSVNWPVNGTLDVPIRPWRDWFQNPRISNRLNNYRCFRGDLKIKVIVNGNAFYWGMAMLSYFARGDLVSNETTVISDINFPGDISRASSRQHILIDPTLSQGGEMTLPFFHYWDNFDLTNGNQEQIGTMWLSQISPLHHPSNTEPVNIKIYAWCENVVLSGPTQVDMAGLVAQAGEDEYSNGPISKPAAKAAEMASMMENIPVIGKYASVAKVGTEAVAKIASKFGYCKPRVVADTNRVTMNLAQELATTDALDTAVGLSFNAKRDITIDPVTTGMGDTDELSFKYLASRPAILAQNIPWNYTDTTDDVLASFRVTPSQYIYGDRVLPPVNGIITFLPCSFVSTPFSYWRGTMRLRLQIVASSFHKGRIQVSWDTRQSLSPVESQVVRSQIVDIAETRDVTFDIGWGNPAPGLRTVGVPPANNTFAIGSNLTAGLNDDNGMISVTVLNKLTMSSATSDPVYINAWVSFPDLEVWGPDSDHFNTLSIYQNNAITLREDEEEEDGVLKAQAGDVTGADITQEDANPPGEMPPDNYIGGTPAPEPAAFMHADPIDSFRTCIKRYCWQEMIELPFIKGADPFVYTEVRRGRWPLYRGHVTGGESGGNTFNGPTTIQAYVAQCYAGMRGGVRVKVINAHEPFVVSGNAHAQVQLCAARAPGAVSGTFSVTGVKDGLVSFEDDSWSGMTQTNPSSGRVLDIELPYYSNTRMVTNNATPQGATPWSYKIYGITSADQYALLNIYTAAADDFNMFGFKGAPQMKGYTVTP
jgi:hypothetical protein